MGKAIKFYFAAIILICLLLWWVDKSQVKPIDWAQTYSLDTKNPYDLYVFNEEIEHLVQPKNIKREWLSSYEYLQGKTSRCTYLIVDKSMSSVQDSMLLGEVAKGSNLFISSENIFKNLTDTLALRYADIDQDMDFDNPDNNYLDLSLINKAWGTKTYKLEPVNNSFAFISLDPKTTTILGMETKFDGKVYPNFIRIKFGKGYVFLHAHPQVFTNKALLDKKSSAEYVSTILSYLPSDLPIVWFVGGQTQKYGTPQEKTTLSIVFQYPALRFAWLLMIYVLILFILFNAKRRQRIIPIIEPVKNTTIEFVQTIGNLYFQKESATEIVNKKITYFLDKIRRRYYLDTSVLDDKFVMKLHLKSGKEKILIEKIVQRINMHKRLKSAVPEDLMVLNQLIEDFWRKE